MAKTIKCKACVEFEALFEVPIPDEKFFFFGRKKIKDYYVKDGVMHCKLEGVR